MDILFSISDSTGFAHFSLESSVVPHLSAYALHVFISFRFFHLRLFPFWIPTSAPLEAQNAMNNSSTCKKHLRNVRNYLQTFFQLCVFIADFDEDSSAFHRLRRNFVENIHTAEIC